ncbi:sigma 54-interacting transcriptional regulator [Panacagrimonas sp.]|uniref:sigma 54-interacting transcriptional regulator n=1 Tax=Panacagrimonas sp. TaxID=2480088 RepID=UPI003B5246C2
MFGLGNRNQRNAAGTDRAAAPDLIVYTGDALLRDNERVGAFHHHLAVGRRFEFRAVPASYQGEPMNSDFVLALFLDVAALDALADAVLAIRRGGRPLTLIVAVRPSQLVSLGRWLDRRASEQRLAGTRLLLAPDLDGVSAALGERMQTVIEDNVIRMPVTTEVENPGYRNFFVFSSKLQSLVGRVRAFAQNGIHRAYLLGGPGAGKTSLAYYYFLVRSKGRFVSVNLAAENTGDKSAVKSLLCGHVAGAFPGAGARIGAFTQARDGVCFLDESHGVVGPVMEVLMEALDNGQYLPFGAAAKQKLDCALLFATNRSWQHLMDSVNIDEFTRLGAATLQVPELAQREEDMIAVTASVMARLAEGCTTWKAPTGLRDDAWDVIRNCRWHGNARALTRTLEAAFVDCAGRAAGELLIPAEDIANGIALWEPKDHHSHKIYGTTA